MRALCLADNHIGRGVRGAITPERLAEQEQVLRDALQLARDEKVQAVLHGGDLFHDRRPVPAVMLAAERPLVGHREAGGPPIIMVNGNHCVSGTAESCAIDVFHEAGLIDLFRRPGIAKVDGVAVACLPWTSASRIVAAADGGDRDDVNAYAAELLLETARGLRAECDGPCVLLSHFAVSGAALPSGLPIDLAREPILPLADLEALGFDAVVLGHIHRSQFLDHDQRILYTGPPMPLDFGDTADEYGCWIIAGDGSSLPEFRPLESRGFATLDCDSDPTDPASLYGLLWPDGIVPAGSYVKLKYAATAEHARRIDHEELRRVLYEDGAHDVWIEPTIIRETRARVEGIDETVSDEDALTLWLETQEDVADHSALRDLHGRYLAEVAA